MTLSFAEWRLAVEIAWDDPWFRWQTLLTGACYLILTALFLTHFIPLGLRNGELVFHYNLYLGIDDVRPWPWVFFVPLIWGAVLAANATASLLAYRHDKIASRVILSLGTAFILFAAIGAACIAFING